MSPIGNPGRVAGFWYLLLIFIGELRFIYIFNGLVHGVPLLKECFEG